MISATRIIASSTAFALLAACGLKGPLYLPPPEPAEGQAAQAPAKPDASKPKPAKPHTADKPSSPN